MIGPDGPDGPVRAIRPYDAVGTDEEDVPVFEGFESMWLELPLKSDPL